jgi:hypothetical protein
LGVRYPARIICYANVGPCKPIHAYNSSRASKLNP